MLCLHCSEAPTRTAVYLCISRVLLRATSVVFDVMFMLFKVGVRIYERVVQSERRLRRVRNTNELCAL